MVCGAMNGASGYHGFTQPHRFGTDTTLGAHPTGTRGDRLSHPAAAAARSGGPRGQHAGRARSERRGKNGAAEILARAPSALRRPPRAAAGPFASRRVRAAARSPRHELAPHGPRRGPDGPRPAGRADQAVQRARSERGASGPARDRHRRPGRPAAVCALRRTAPKGFDRPRSRRQPGASRARRADERDGPRCRAHAARSRPAAEGRSQPERRPGHAPAHGDRGVCDGCGVDRSRAQLVRGRAGGADARPGEARPPIRPRGARREGRRPDGHRGRRRRSVELSGFADFWAGRDLWREPMIAGILAGAILGYIGVFIVLKRMVFVSAALSEISGVGVAFAFWLGAVMGVNPHQHAAVPVLLEPTWFSLLFACAAAAVFSTRPGHRKLAPETIVGLGYIVASALVLAILNSPRIAQEAHAVGDILFGNAVTVPRRQIVALFSAALAAVIVHAIFFKELLFVSYDPETAVVQGMGVFRYELLLNLATAIVISVATRAVGALPVFAFSVIPAAAALMLTDRIRLTIALSVLFGVISAAVGYYVSWVEQLPTGATMVVVAALFLLPGLVKILRRSAV